jgi:hypothetical protein
MPQPQMYQLHGPPAGGAYGVSPPNGVGDAAAAGAGRDAFNADEGTAVKQDPAQEHAPPVVVQNPVTVDEKGNRARPTNSSDVF